MNKDNREILFESLDFLKSVGIKPTSEKYNKVYTSTIDDGKTLEVLERIFTKFNIGRPDDFKGHSLSVSDVVELNGDFFYCDRYGFKNISF